MSRNDLRQFCEKLEKGEYCGRGECKRNEIRCVKKALEIELQRDPLFAKKMRAEAEEFPGNIKYATYVCAVMGMLLSCLKFFGLFFNEEQTDMKIIFKYIGNELFSFFAFVGVLIMLAIIVYNCARNKCIYKWRKYILKVLKDYD